MSKSITTALIEGHKTPKMSMKSGREDEEHEDGDEFTNASSATLNSSLTTAPTAPPAIDQFMNTPEFKRHFVEFVHVETLMALRSATKGWNAATNALINEKVESDELILHVFYYCKRLENVDLLHMNLQEIGHQALDGCSELTSMTVPDSLQKFGYKAFLHCSKIVPSNINVDDNDAVIAYLRSQQSTTTATWATDEFMHTPEFKRHFVDFVHVETMMALRLATKGWNAAADALIDEGVESGELLCERRLSIRA